MSFLSIPEPNAEAQKFFDDDVAELGHVMNASRLWAYEPAIHDGLFDLMRQTTSAHRLTMRQRGILVTATASTIGDSYCALAWGCKLTKAADAQTAGAVLRGDDEGLTASEQALADWARKVARDANGTSAADVQELRDAGFSEAEIFAVTVYIALRMAFSTVNDALGARPDGAYRSTAPQSVLDAVTYGRPIEDQERTAVDQDVRNSDTPSNTTLSS